MTRRRSRQIVPGQRRRGRRVSRLPPLDRGFSSMGMGPFWSWLLPSLRGRERRHFFNQLSSWIVVSLGLAGSVLGFDLAGPLGALAGCVTGIVAGAAFAVKRRFFRP